MKRKTDRQRLQWALAGLALAAFGLPACSSDTQQTTDKRMFVSNEDFKQGRDDGRRDAKASWSDTSGAWTWDWMMSNQYRQGYKQGWREGRAEVKFESEKSNAEKLQQE